MFVKNSPKGAILSVKVVPGARISEIAAAENDYLRIRISALPEKGKANDELVRFLSKKTKIPKTLISIAYGSSSRQKEILFQGFKAEEISKVLKL